MPRAAHDGQRKAKGRRHFCHAESWHVNDGYVDDKGRNRLFRDPT